MTVEFQYDNKARVIHVHPGEHLSLKSMQVYFQKILDNQEIEPGFVEVVHFDEVKEFNYSSSEAFLVSDLIKKVKDKKEDKGAVIVAKTDLQYGMARMLALILDDYFPVSIVRNVNDLGAEIERLQG